MNDNNDSSNVGVVVGVSFVDLKLIELDGSTQVRVAADAGVISEYTEVLDVAWYEGEEKMLASGVDDGSVDEEDAWPFPAVVLFADGGGRLWVADGFHRISAAHASEFGGVLAEVREGGVKGALEYALGANVSHGLRRSSEDVRRCVELGAMEYVEYSDRRLAKLVGCSRKSVRKYRPEGSRLGNVVGADGKMYGVANRGLSEGMDEGEVNEGAEGYVDDGVGEREVSVGVDRGGVVCGEAPASVVRDADGVREYDMGYVRMDARPGVAEVMPWVDSVNGMTYGELMEESDVEVVRMCDACGEVCDMVERKLVVEWCEMERMEGIVRWNGWRSKPVSLEHAERERAKWLEEMGRGDLVAWLGDLIGGVRAGVVGVPDGLILDEVRKLLPRESVALVDEVLEDDGDEVTDVERLLMLVLATPLLMRGVESVEVDMLGMGGDENGGEV